LNGNKVTQFVLKPGDVIEVGSSRITFKGLAELDFISSLKCYAAKETRKLSKFCFMFEVFFPLKKSESFQNFVSCFKFFPLKKPESFVK
jgi:hypothetical protein